MSYFKYTAQDLGVQRAAGITETKRELGEAIAALAEDTARKMNGATAEDEDAEREYDRGYLLEDLLSRMMLIAEACEVPNLGDLFPAAHDGQRVTMAYPLLTGEEDPAEDTQPLRPVHPARGVAARPAAPIISDETIRQAHNLTTFDGYARHPFRAGPDGVACAVTLYPVRSDAGPERACYFGKDNAIHDYRLPGK